MWLFTKVIVIECIIIVIMNNSMTMNINAKIRETAILISKSQFDTKTLFYNQGYQSFK